MHWSPVINYFVDCENAELEIHSMKWTLDNKVPFQE